MSKQDEKNTFDRIYGADTQEKKTPWLLVAAIALALVAVILLTVFLVSYLGVVHLTSVDNGVSFLDKKQDITYLLAPMCYEPVAIWSDDVYAKYEGMDFYEVRDAKPEEYLCYKDADIGLYDLYYAEGITLPTLAEFGAKRTRVCATGLKSIMMHSIEDKTAEIVSYFLSSPTVDDNEITGVETTYDLKLMSEKYDFMYYTITFYQTKGGDSYLFDRTTGRCVKIAVEAYTEAILGDAS